MGKSIKHREKLRRLAEPGTTITTIGPIRVCLKEEFRIGKGSEGTSVYVGLHEDGSEVAVKRVLINSPKCLKANLTEKEILSLLQVKTSQHIVNYRYLEYENPFSYLILDLCEETLEEYVKEHDQEHLKHHGPVIIRDILTGLFALHHGQRKKILHLDLKPQNILVDSKGRMRLSDFGISRILNEEQSTLQTGRKGTRGWMAAESIPEEGNKVIKFKRKSDIQVVGMISFYVLTKGKHPFGDFNYRVQHIIEGNPVNLQQLSNPLARSFVAWMISHNIEDRPYAEDALKHAFLEKKPEVGIVIDDGIPPIMQSNFEPRKYFFVKLIGCGSCGKVYLYETKDRLQNCAVKQVDLTMNDRETELKVKDLKKEIQILKKLKHNNIVVFYLYEETAETLSMFMEYVPGGSVSDYVMKNGEIEENLVRKYTYQILKGCEYLHRNDVIHRNIKGGNVLIDDAKGSIRLAGFGTAMDLRRVVTSTGSSTDERYWGTIYWCSPEHLKQEDPAYVFDIWSVGCTVVEMLTTKPPHRDLDSFQAFFSILNEVFHPPEHLSLLAKTFIELCFKKKEERPNATELLKNEFPAEYMP